jgi:DNA-binding response OmpR family regulator
MRVLVVEDEKKMASFIRKALLAEGFAVDVRPLRLYHS